MVAFEEGFNVWHIIPSDEDPNMPIKVALIGEGRFPVADNSLVDLRVQVKNKTIYVDMNGHCLSVSHPDIPEKIHVGITACEGINRFYTFYIEE